MAAETELERLVVRFVGDASDYEQALKESIDLTESFIAKSAQLTRAEEDRQKQLSEIYGDRNAVVKEGAAAIEGTNSVMEAHTIQIGKIIEVLDKWITSQEAITRASEESSEALRGAEEAGGKMLEGTDKVKDSVDEASTRINDAGTVMGAFAIKTERGAARAMGNLGRTASQAGLAIQIINPQLGQTVTTIGLLTASVGQAAATIYKAKAAFSGLVSLALNPLTLVAIPLAVTGLVLWKRHSDAVKKAQEDLEETTKRVAKAAEDYGKYLQIFGKVPGIEPEEGEAQRQESAAKARYKNANLDFQAAQKELAEMQRRESLRRRQWERDNPLTGEETAIEKSHRARRLEDFMNKSPARKAMEELAGKMGAASELSERARREWDATKAPAGLEKASQAWDKFIAQQEKRRLLGREATEIEKTLFDMMEAGVTGPMLRYAQRTMEQDALDDKRLDQQKALTDEINRQNRALEEEAVEKYNRQLDEARRLTEKFLTPQEKLVETRERLDELLKARGEEWRPTYDRALKAANEEAAGLKKNVRDARIEVQGLTSIGWGSAGMWAQLRNIGFAGEPAPDRAAGEGSLTNRWWLGPKYQDVLGAPGRVRASERGWAPSGDFPGVPAHGFQETASRTEALLEKIAVLAEKHWGGGVAFTLESAGLKG